jgi:hypothetical protein
MLAVDKNFLTSPSYLPRADPSEARSFKVSMTVTDSVGSTGTELTSNVLTLTDIGLTGTVLTLSDTELLGYILILRLRWLLSGKLNET